jgi:excisionase family DNA binding protein
VSGYGQRRRLATIEREPIATELLTPADVARILRFTPKHVTYLARAGVLPSLQIGNRYRFHATDLEDWIKANTKGRPPSDVDLAIEWLAERNANLDRPLCPRCARHPQQPSGICAVCEDDDRRAEAAKVDRERARRLRYWHSDKGKAAAARRNTKRRTGPADAQ